MDIALKGASDVSSCNKVIQTRKGWIGLEGADWVARNYVRRYENAITLYFFRVSRKQ